jgi:hypothetical protein
MESHHYTCEYCSAQFKPTRRGIQRFCKSSCRATSFNKKKKSLLVKNKSELEVKKPIQIEKVSMPGILNAAAGTLIADGVQAIAKNIFFKEEDKPATKKDIALLSKSLLKERYILILNLVPRFDGLKAYFDTQTQNLVYLAPITNQINLNK